MTKFINQHSFTLSATILIVIVGVLSLRSGVSWRRLLGVGGLTLGLAVSYLLLRPGPGTLEQTEQIYSEINAGTPVLIEFQSPY